MTSLFTTLFLPNAAELFQLVSDNMSYWLIFLLMVVESSFIPFPSEIIVPPAAYLACTHSDNMNVVAIVIVATLGALCGSLINYYLSLWIGRPIVYRFASGTLGNMLLVTPQKIEHAEQYFDKHGAVSTFIGRLIPAVRQLISIPAGLARMNIWVFMAFTTLGASLWNIILAALGWWLGTRVPYSQLFDAVEKYNSYLSYAGFGLLGICVIYIIWRGMHRPSSSNPKKNA